MPNPLAITLRGITYAADEPTQSEALALLCLMVAGSTEAEQVESLVSGNTGLLTLDLEDKQAQVKFGAEFVFKLQNPIVTAKLCYLLRQMFPTLPENLVRYNLQSDGVQDFRCKLEPLEVITDIVTPVTKWLSAEQGTIESAPAKSKRRGRAAA